MENKRAGKKVKADINKLTTICLHNNILKGALYIRNCTTPQ